MLAALEMDEEKKVTANGLPDYKLFSRIASESSSIRAQGEHTAS